MSSGIKKIVITGARDNFRVLSARRLRRGFKAVFFPTIEIRPLKFRLPPGGYDWVVFTSANAVRVFAGRVRKDIFRTVKVAAIGGETAAELRRKKIKVDFAPGSAGSKGFLKEFLRGWNVKGKKILLPRSSLALDTVPDGLCKAGASVDSIAVYDNIRPKMAAKKVRAFVSGWPYHFIFFSSPSSFENFMKIKGLPPLPGAVRTAAIGPVTAAAMKARGVRPEIVAQNASFKDALERIMDYKEGAR